MRNIRSPMILFGTASERNRRGAQLQGAVTTGWGMERKEMSAIPGKQLNTFSVLRDQIPSVHSSANPWEYVGCYTIGHHLFKDADS
jgi:hypothetical protein